MGRETALRSPLEPLRAWIDLTARVRLNLDLMEQAIESGLGLPHMIIG